MTSYPAYYTYFVLFFFAACDLKKSKEETSEARPKPEIRISVTGAVPQETLLFNSRTVEPRFNEVAGDRPNLFVKWRVRYIEVLFHTFYCNFGRAIYTFVISRTSLNRGSLNRGSTVPKME